jgi:hypothetical protein
MSKLDKILSMDGYADDTGGECPICGHDHLDHEPDKSDFKSTIKALFLELVDNTAQLYLYEEGSEKVADFLNDLNKVIGEL